MPVDEFYDYFLLAWIRDGLLRDFKLDAWPVAPLLNIESGQDSVENYGKPKFRICLDF